MSLRERQSKFVRNLIQLIQYGHTLGYEFTLGDAYRDPRVEWTYGAKNSKHKERLAIDLNLFKDGKYLPETKDHRALGAYWKSLGGTWGGDFARPDGNHYEWNR